jgi:hypothetical protein
MKKIKAKQKKNHPWKIQIKQAVTDRKNANQIKEQEAVSNGKTRSK